MPARLQPLLVLLLLLFAGTGVSACGEDSSGSTGTAATEAASDSKRERSLIRRTVKRARSEAMDGSAAKTCSYITSDAQKRAIQAYGLRYNKQLTLCPQMVRFARRTEQSYLSDARRATIERITMHSSRRATVAMEGPKIGGAGGTVDLVLRKMGSRWLIDDASFVPYGSGE